MLKEATHIEVFAKVRYWDDAIVNGVEDHTGELAPCRQGEMFIPVINLTTGKIENWPDGTTAKIHYKICDNGEYWLTDARGNRIAKWKTFYVPDDFLCHGDNGYGDYIIMKIDETGHIIDYRKPKIDSDQWIYPYSSITTVTVSR